MGWSRSSRRAPKLRRVASRPGVLPPCRLLQRLALHGWSRRRDVTGTQKLTWLLKKDWLYTRALKHEAFQLVASALATASPASRNRLLARARRGPRRKDMPSFEGRQYEAYNLLEWIVRHDPTWGAAS